MNDVKLNDNQMAEALRQEGWGCESPATFRIDMEESFLEIWEKAAPYTMISMERGYALYGAVRHILDRNIPGDFVECGVWKGGSCMLMALTLLEAGISDRRIWMYDTYSGMPEPGEEDRIASSGQAVSERWSEGWWAAGTELVRSHLLETGYPMEHFRMVEGDVCLTLDQSRPIQAALLRLDTDWYASTKKELETLYPGLSTGGVLIIDDYGHFSGARKAVDEYFADPAARPLFQRSDYTGRCALKY